MPQFKVQAPDGKVITVEGPEGATEEQAIAFAQKQAGAEPAGRSLGGALVEGATNIPDSAMNFAGDIAQTVMHPWDTAVSVKNLGQGVMEKLGIMSGKDHEQYADAVGQMLKDRYGSWENIKKTLATDPVGMMADVSTVLTGGGSLAARAPGVAGKIGKVAAKAGSFADPLQNTVRAAKGVGKVGAELAGGLGTFTAPESIAKAFESNYQGGKSRDEFNKNMRGQAPARSAVDDARKAVQNIATERGNAYRATMKAGVSKDKTILSWNDIDTALDQSEDIATFSGMSGTGPTQVVNQSTEAVRNEIRKKINHWQYGPGMKASEYWTPLGFDALKRQIGDVADRLGATEPGSPSHKVAMTVYNAIKDTIIKQAPDYAKIMTAYDDASDVIKELNSTLSLNKNATVDTALRKLQSTLRNNANTNYGRRKELVDMLTRAGAPHLMEKLAGQDLSSWFPRGIGRYLGAAELGGILESGNLEALAILPFMSPRIVGEAAGAAGRVAGAASKLPLDAIGKTAYQSGRAYDAIENAQPSNDPLRITVNPARP